MTPAHKLQVVQQYIERMEAPEWAVNQLWEAWDSFTQGQHVIDLDQLLKSLKSPVWLGKKYLGCNSTTAVDVMLRDGTHLTGVGALYGITLFITHQCNAKLAFDEHKADCPAQSGKSWKDRDYILADL